MASNEHLKSHAKQKPTGKKAEVLSQKKQSERFKEAARELEADETGEAFKRAVGVILPAEQTGSGKSKR